MKIMLPLAVMALGLSACCTDGNCGPKEKFFVCNAGENEQKYFSYMQSADELQSRLNKKLIDDDVDLAEARSVIGSVNDVKGKINASYTKLRASCDVLSDCTKVSENDLNYCSEASKQWALNDEKFDRYDGMIKALKKRVDALELRSKNGNNSIGKTDVNRDKNCSTVVGTVFTECN